MIYTNNITKYLKLLSILHLLIPNLLFSTYWVKNPIGVLASILLIFGSFLFIKQDLNQNKITNKFNINYLNVFFIALISIFLTLISGAGGFSDQIYDYLGHNTKFRDLYEKPWPFRYTEVDSYPCYYFGYYLVPAFLAKIFNHVRIFSMIWTAFGMFLVLFWSYILISKKSLVYLFIFLLFGGLYTTGNHIFEIATSKINFVDLYWSDFKPMSDAFLIYMPLYLSSVWVPNQFIPSCIVVGFIAYEIFYEQKGYKSVALIPLLAIWAPFPAVSIVLIILGNFIHNSIKNKSLTLNISDFWPAIIFTIGCLPIFLYLLSSKSGETASGFIWKFDNNWLIVWLLFILLEFGIIVFCIINFTKKAPQIALDKSLFSILIVLCILPVFHFGRNNDFTARACIPAFYLLNIILTNRISYMFKRKSILKYAIISLILIGAFVPVKVMWRGTFQNKLFGEPKTYFVHGDMYQVLKNYHSPAEANQYLADNNSFFVKYLMKK
jgi:hypothetical protein